MTYLGKAVGQSHVQPVYANVSVVDEFPVPTTKKELFGFGRLLPLFLPQFLKCGGSSD